MHKTRYYKNKRVLSIPIAAMLAVSPTIVTLAACLNGIV
jgi:hypothetical protein